MSTENLAMLAVGQIIAAGVFALGVLVGSSLHRKEATNDDSNEGTTIKDADWWHDPVGPGNQGGAVRSRGSCAGQERQARSSERALG